MAPFRARGLAAERLSSAWCRRARNLARERRKAPVSRRVGQDQGGDRLEAAFAERRGGLHWAQAPVGASVSSPMSGGGLAGLRGGGRDNDQPARRHASGGVV